MFELKNLICLAPMAGYTDSAFRILAKNEGCDLTVTEMLSVKALSYKDKKSLQMTQTQSEKGLKGIQIFGKEPQLFKRVTRDYLNQLDYDFIDINMGCPAPKIFKNGEGSALLNQPDLAMSLVDAVKSVSNKPVAVKMRLGVEQNTALNFAQRLERAGADFITVHGRTREQMYQGEADWQTIEAIANDLKIAVIGNGDINSPELAVDKLQHSAVTAIMIGRAAQGAPWLFRQTKELLEQGSYQAISLAERLELISKQMDLMLKIKPEKVVICEIRKHIAAYLKGLYGANNYKNQINNSHSIKEINTILQKMLDNCNFY